MQLAPDPGDIAAKLVRGTSVKENTLDPKWNEKFQLIVDNSDTDKFHLDIWCVINAQLPNSTPSTGITTTRRQ